MLIENPDAFKTWLTSVLEPLCEADPAALAKYVYALVKKDKPLDDLRDGMVDQLDVFLQQETKPFVDLLFKTLETQEYLSPPKTAGENNEISNTSPLSPQAEKDSKSVSPDSDFKAEKENDEQLHSENKRDNSSLGGTKQRIVLNRTNKFVPATVPKEKPPHAMEQTLVKVMPDLLEDSLNEPLPARNSRRDKKSDSDKEERRRRVYRSRSRSWERNRRPPQGGGRGGGKPMWRNRSPPQQPPIRYRRSRSGSPPPRAPRYRNLSPPGVNDADSAKARSSRSRSRERMLSPTPGIALRDRLDRVSRERERDRQSRAERPLRERTDRERDRIDRDRERDRIDRERDRADRDRILDRDRRNMRDGAGGADTPTQDSNPGDCTGQSRGTTTTLAGIFTPAQKKRCRDFDEKGYCMRGDLCQFDHGSDPVVLEDASLSRVLLPIAGIPPPRPVPGYNPLAPDIWSRSAGFTAPPPPPPPPTTGPPPAPLPHHMQRELIPIPTVSVDDMRPLPPGVGRGLPPGPVPLLPPGVRPTVLPQGPMPLQMSMQTLPHQHHNKFDYNRLGHQTRHHSPKIPGGNCSLELKKVPRGLNDILHLNNHFSKFGKIVNIQVCYEGDPEAAIITFSSHTEANVAYKSTEAVLNNRFIKVFWHNSENKQDTVQSDQRTTKPKPGMMQHNNSNHVVNNKVLINKDTTKKASSMIESNKLQNNNLINKQPQEATDATGNNNNVLPGDNATEEAATTAANGSAENVVQEKASNGSLAPGNKMEIHAAEIASLVKKREEGRAKIVHDIRKRTQSLLEKQIQSQRDLLKRLDDDISQQQRQIVMDAIKANQKCIDKTKEEYMTLLKQGQQVSGVTSTSLVKKPRSREEAQKEILDAELDIFTKQQEGQDVTDLVKKVADLRRQYRHPVPARRGGIHQNYRMRKKSGAATRAKFMKLAAIAKSTGMLFTNQSVDHRPKSLLISGYESDEQAQVEQHFAQFGEIVRRVVDPNTPSLWIHFDTRKNAEMAMAKGKQFNDRTLSVTWVAEPVKRLSLSGPSQQTPSVNPSTPQKSEPTSTTESDNREIVKQRVEHNMDEIDFEVGDVELSEELLLQDDEEEDEDTREDRSWRR